MLISHALVIVINCSLEPASHILINEYNLPCILNDIYIYIDQKKDDENLVSRIFLLLGKMAKNKDFLKELEECNLLVDHAVNDFSSVTNPTLDSSIRYNNNNNNIYIYIYKLGLWPIY